MKLHNAVRLKNRLNRVFRSAKDSDDEQVEGYMMEEDRCDNECIEGYMMKTVSDEKRQKIEAHLEKCDSCSKTLADLQELRDSIEDAFLQLDPGEEQG